MMSMLKVRKGFTLVEVLIVVSLGMLVTGAGLTSFRDTVRRQTVLQSAEQVNQVMQEARTNALSGKKDCSVCGCGITVNNPLIGWRVTMGSNSYVLDGLCGTNPAAPTPFYTSGNRSLPGGVVASSNPGNTVTFKPGGQGTNLSNDLDVTVFTPEVAAREVAVSRGGEIGSPREVPIPTSTPAPTHTPMPTATHTPAPTATNTPIPPPPTLTPSCTVNLNPGNIPSLIQGTSRSLYVTPVPVNGTVTAILFSSNSTAVVADPVLDSTAPYSTLLTASTTTYGTATVTARCMFGEIERGSRTLTVTVPSPTPTPPPPTGVPPTPTPYCSVGLNPVGPVTIQRGSTMALYVTPVPYNGTISSINFSSSNALLVGPTPGSDNSSAGGYMTTLRASTSLSGTANITARCMIGGIERGNRTLTVNVPSPTPMPPTPTPLPGWYYMGQPCTYGSTNYNTYWYSNTNCTGLIYSPIGSSCSGDGSGVCYYFTSSSIQGRSYMSNSSCTIYGSGSTCCGININVGGGYLSSEGLKTCTWYP